MKFLDKFGKELMIIDGAMGTQLQQLGLKAGEIPETWNFTHRNELLNIHRAYIEAGADIITTNSFGANALKMEHSGYTVEEIVRSSVEIAKEAASAYPDRQIFIGADLGPTGKLLEPYGDLKFEEAYELFKEQVIVAEKAGADVVLIETMGDLYELKAAILAVKENTNLPVVASMIFNEKGQLLTGADIMTSVFTLEGLGVDGIGINCGLGPKQMIEYTAEMLKYASVPITVNPNAGLPESINGVTFYNVGPEEFGEDVKKIVKLGASAVGGCCGTTPAHIKSVSEKCPKNALSPVKAKHFTAVTSYSKTAIIGEKPIIIGERINPTGKKKLKAALVEKNFDYIITEAVKQADKNSDVLDVNMGLPEIDEAEMLVEAVKRIQGVVNLPLQLDTSDVEALEKALRIYNGKALINSVNGKKDNMEKVFPLAKKYGGVVVCLCLDENGIPETAEGRIKVAEKIIKTAESYGISKNNLIVDTLVMTVSTGKDNAKITLDALDYVRHTLGVNTVLGVSNVSFGLPTRENINTAFFTMAMQKGLSAGIINPLSDGMMNAYYSFCALNGMDDNCENYIKNITQAEVVQKTDNITLHTAILKGMQAEAGNIAKSLLETEKPLDVINNEIIPALDEVGAGFEKGTLFLPQLLMSADSAKAAFEEIKQKLANEGAAQEKSGKIVIATVKGDVHDIGKNIVKVLLENYGFEVIDLGKDVDEQLIVDTVKKENVPLVGLSALMTTTVANMEIAIKLLHKECPGVKIFVGGAVMTQDYADRIGADFYAKDAMCSVRFAEEFFKKN